MPENRRKHSSRTNFFLYCTYFATCLEDRTWSFCVSICMDLMGGMRMVSIEQFVEGILQMMFSGHLGKYFDKLTRKRAIMTVVPMNNLSTCASAAFIITCLSIDPNSKWYIVYLILAMFFCSINRLYMNAEKFIVGKDWVMVIGGNAELSKLNATLLTLDQLTNVIGPLLTGALVSWVGLRETLGIFGATSIVLMLFKAIFLRLLYTSNRLLHVKEDKTSLHEPTSALLKESVLYTYYRQESFPAAFGMALLFMTVMGFGGLAVGYGSSSGLPEVVIGAFRSYGSISAILGAISYAFFERKYGVLTSGILGLLVQQVFSILAVTSVFLPGSPMNLTGYIANVTTGQWFHSLANTFEAKNATGYDPHPDWSTFTSNGVSLASIVVFLIAIASARYGLWCLDLATTHVMQVTVPEKERNTVFGVHNGICQLFSIFKDILVIALPLPATFAICIFVSYAFVSVGHLCFVYYALKSRNSPIFKRNIPKKVVLAEEESTML